MKATYTHLPVLIVLVLLTATSCKKIDQSFTAENSISEELAAKPAKHYRIKRILFQEFFGDYYGDFY